MRILRVITSMDPLTGGPCQGIRNSIPELAKYGVKNEVLCLDRPDATFLGKDSFPIHAIGERLGPWQYNSKLKSWLLNNLCNFDIVIIHGLWLYHGYAVRKALQELKERKRIFERKTKIPKLFIFPHGMLDPYFQNAAGRRFKAIRNLLYWKYVEHKVINDADGVLFTCEEEMRIARLPFKKYHPKKEINIGYGITEPPLYNRKLKEAFERICPEIRSDPYFLFLSRIHDKKGLDLLIKAYINIIEDFKNSNLTIPKLVIAGPGLETSYGKNIIRLAYQSSELRSYIHFTGMLSGDAKWGALYGSEAFVLPSHQENFGIAVAEALACSKPVLISNKVNIWREIKQWGGGLIADNNIEGVKSLLLAWLNETEQSKTQMSRNALKIYESHFTIEATAKELIKEFKKL